MYTFTETWIIPWVSESGDYNKDQYEQWNALWWWNSKNHCGENMAPSLLQSFCRSLNSSQSLLQISTEVLAVSWFDYWNSQSRSILNVPPSLQMLSGARENALPESESSFQSSRGGWEHLEVFRPTVEGNRSIWEVCVWLADWITYCRWSQDPRIVNRIKRNMTTMLFIIFILSFLYTTL
jgi:hypothetical protein